MTPQTTNARPQTTNAPSAQATAEAQPQPRHDTTREIFETVVFVVVLVLMLKLFVAEAFVIPTGSMASTLWGDQVICKCRECGHVFPINASQDSAHVVVHDYTCENCGFQCSGPDVEKDLQLWWLPRLLGQSPYSPGDRVLVSKFAYHIDDPHRFDIPVFKYPVEPFAEKDMQGMNYIKRLVGIGGNKPGEPGETIAVFAGDLYKTRDLNYDQIPAEKRPPSEKDAWHFDYMYPNDPVAVEYFKDGKFEIIRKTPDQMLAMRRIVFDLDHQPKSAEGIKKTRWHPVPDDGAGWQMEAAGFKHTGDQFSWMRYQHINPWMADAKPYLIVDSLGYNHFSDPERRSMNTSNPFVENAANRWVSDLILDCSVEIASPDSEVILELNKGPNRCDAIFAKGECRLVRYLTTNGKEERIEMGSHPTKMNRAGTYKLRFANVDCRLSVWVDGSALAFAKEQSDYPPPPPTQKFESTDNDLLQPARIGANGQVTCSKVSLWRDLLYNCGFRSGPKQKELEPDAPPPCDYVQTYYVQPGHYLMFGDNVNSSADSRYWGLVPQRLMLGHAIVVYWPPSRVGVIE
jgi:signal peptidase I